MSPRFPLSAYSCPPISDNSRNPQAPRRYCRVTTTISPRPARVAPSYQVFLALPPIKPPPLIHTITGRFFASACGVQIFTAKQSSAITELLFSVGSISTSWGQAGAKSNAGWTSVQEVGETGGRNRKGPTGGDANRIPRKTKTPLSVAPNTGPEVVLTTSPVVPFNSTV